jgi:DNA primase
MTSSPLRFSSINNISGAVKDLLLNVNIQIQSESGKEITTYCPFHKNIHSPSFYININTGLWQCFNPSCGKRGNFRQLYKHLTGKSYSKEWILDPVNLQKELDKALIDDELKNDLSLDSIAVSADESIQLFQTLIDRGYSLEIINYFEIGYSKIKDRVVIPVRDQNYKLVGFIGRAIHSWQDPRYLYNKGFKRADVLFNLNNAKFFDSVYVCEGSLDAIRIAQAGFKNVVATLGAQVSEKQMKMLRKYFDEINIFSDNDDAGRTMRDAIINGCRGKRMYEVAIPDELKDPGDMTVEQIQNTIKNKKNIIGG